MIPTRKSIARAFSHGEILSLGLTSFQVVEIDGVPVLQARNWHGASSVIASWYPQRARDPQALIVVIWDNRRQFRKPFPLSDHYKHQ